MAITLKVESELFIDPDYFMLTDRQKAILWAILCNASAEDGITVKKIDFIFREKCGIHLKVLENTGFITLHDENILPTGRLARRVTSTADSRKQREKARAARNPLDFQQNSENNQPAMPQNTPSSDLDDWGSQETEESTPIIPQKPASVVVAQPKPLPATKPKKAKPSDHEEGVRELMISDGLDEKTADDLLTHRAFKKARMTIRAWEDAKREAGRAQWSINAAVDKWLAKGWTGFEAKWVADLPKPDVHFVTASTAQTQIEQPGMVKNNFGQWRKRNGGVAL